MSFLVQTEAGDVDGANAYISAAEFRAYHEDRAADIAAYTDRDLEGAIIDATDHLDRNFRWRGVKNRIEQRTAWPRAGAVDDDGFARGDVPFEVKDACAEYAIVALTEELDRPPTFDETGAPVQSKTETVGPITESTTYVTGATFHSRPVPRAERKVRGLIESGMDIGRG